MTAIFSSPMAVADPSTVQLAEIGRPPLARFIDPATLVELLNSVKGTRIVTIMTRTEPRLLAKHRETGDPNPYRGNVVKISRVNGMIGWVYSNSVNNQRQREGVTDDFEPFKRTWGTRLPRSPFVEHRGQLYLELKVERSLDHRYETLDGQPVDAALIEPYLPQRRPGRQGVEREVLLRDYALESVQSLKLGGVTYILRHPATEDMSIFLGAAAA